MARGTASRLAAALFSLALLVSLAAPFRAGARTPYQEESPTVYVVLAIDTENADWSWYPGYSLENDPSPVFDTSNYQRSSSNMSTIFSEGFRDAHRDSFGEPFKMSWFVQMDPIFDPATYKDEGPDHPELTGTRAGFTGVLDTLLRYWADEVRQAGDGVYWHHHVQTWTGAAWVGMGAAIDGYAGHFDALNHMLLDMSYFPSTFRSGWTWEDSNLSAFLEEWVPFDLSALKGEWKPYHPNATNPWSQAPPNQSRWMARIEPAIDEDRLNEAFEQAGREGKALYGFFFHDKDNMPLKVGLLHDALVMATTRYPSVKFRYVSAQDGMQRMLGMEDRTPPVLSVTREGDTTLQVTSNEPLWQGKPYVAARYSNGSQELYRHVTATPTGDNRWIATVPWQAVITPPAPSRPEYHPVRSAASGLYGSSYRPSKAFDGSDSSYWDSHGGTYPAWILLDLGSAKSVAELSIQFFDKDGRSYSYYVESSAEGGSWRMVVPETTAKGLATHTLSPAAEMRYLRITVNGNTVNKDAHIREIRLLGPTPENLSPPSPVTLFLDRVGAGASDLSGNPGAVVVSAASPVPSESAGRAMSSVEQQVAEPVDGTGTKP